MSKGISELMAIKLIPEIFDEVSMCTTPESVAQTLSRNQSPALKLALQYLFHPAVNFEFKELPKYTPDPGGENLSPSSLFVEMRRMYLFDKSKNLPLKKKNELLLQILESVHPSEAEFIGRMFTRNLQIPLLTYELVRKTFPGLLPEQD
jgi:hypothetical protein